MKRVAPALVLSVFALVAPLRAQQPSASHPAQPPVFRSQTQLVPLNVTVMDSNQQFVKGLTAADFAVFEDGVQQDVRFFESTQVPVDLIILLDTSSSMQDKMSIVHEAAIGFFATLREEDRGALVTFADRVEIVQPLTTDRTLLEKGVRGTAARGATALHNAIYIALREFGRGAQSSGDIRRQAIVVLSDGEDTSSLVSLDDVLSVARKSGVSIYTISVQSEHGAARIVTAGQRRQYSESDFSMRRLAQETGAQAFFPLQISEIRGIYHTIGQELSSQYSIAYAPTNTQKDGGYRRIVVRVALRPELRLRTRTGYTAEPVRVSMTSTYGQRR